MQARTIEKIGREQRSTRGPAWRSKVAQEMTTMTRRSAAQPGDPLTIETAKYFALRSTGLDGRVQAAATYPTIDAAIKLNGDSALIEVVKLLILVDSQIDVVAARIGVEPKVVEIWEQLFFDVRGMRGAVGWMSSKVVDEERKAGNTALAARMKLALVAGVEGVNAILAMGSKAPVDEAEHLFQRKLKLSLKFDEAADAPIVSECNRLAYLKLFVNLQHAERRLEFAGEKLAARCAEVSARFDLAKARMEVSQARAVIRANEKQQDAERRHRAQEDRSAKAARALELAHNARLAEQRAEICRAAQSPLSRLSWGKPKPEIAMQPESISLVDLEVQIQSMIVTAKGAQDYNTNSRLYETGSQKWRPEVSIATHGGA